MTPEYIIIHHSLTDDDVLMNWGAIKRYHTSWRHNGEIVTKERAFSFKAAGEKIEPPWDDIG